MPDVRECWEHSTRGAALCSVVLCFAADVKTIYPCRHTSTLALAHPCHFMNFASSFVGAAEHPGHHQTLTSNPPPFVRHSMLVVRPALRECGDTPCDEGSPRVV